MSVPRADEMIDAYQGNTWLIHRLVEGVSDEESVLQPPFEANCLNWIVGHIVHRRNSSLACLGRAPMWGAQTAAKYQTGSPPIRSASAARSFSDLVADLDESQQALELALADAKDEDLDAIVENDRGTKSAIDHLSSFHWHETYHLGQLEILRAFVESQR